MAYTSGNYSENGIQCILGFCVYPKESFLNRYQAIHANVFTLPIIGAIQHDLPSLQVVYRCIFMLLAATGLVNNTFSLMTCLRDRIRYTICGVYLIMYSTCSLVLMVLLLTNIATVMYYDEPLARLWACHGYPYLTLTMADTSILISAAIAVEGVLTKCFKYDKFRRRTVAILNSISFLFIASISNLDKLFARYLIIDRVGHLYCLHESYSSKSWSTILLFFYVLLPCVIHFICVTCILSTRSNDSCLHKVFRYQHYVMPSLFILLCLLLNGSYRYFFHFYLTGSSKYIIRLHVAFILLLYAPQAMTYVIYVTTEEFYVKEFYQIWFYRKLCCCFYNRRRHVQEFEVIHRLWQRRTSLETVKTISNLDDICMDSEFYKK